MKCDMCPRHCMAVRSDGKTGKCHMTSDIYLARAALHFWEEPCISGEKGSGAVFFSGCPLGCVYCQNKKISRGEVGKKISTERLIEIFFELYDKGAENINLVTPTHYTEMIIPAIEKAKSKGLSIPFVYNCGGYESVKTLESLSGLIDIYMPDFKYMSGELAKKYSFAEDYPEVAKRALDEMVRQQGEIVFEDGMMRRGVLIRHMLLPGCLSDSKKVLKYLFGRYGYQVYFSIMSQYTPVSVPEKFPELMRRVAKAEYEELVDFCCDLGMENAFVQEGEAAEESFIPEFDLEGV